MKASLLLFIVLFLLLFLGGLVVWIFDPALRFIENSKIDLDNPDNWQVTDKYTTANEKVRKERVDVTVIFPAFDEEVRLPVTLEKAARFLAEWSHRRKLTYEIVIVDDGSRDHTHQEALRWQSLHPQVVRVIRLRKNQGKGGAVKVGVKEALGSTILMADADGATEIEDLDTLYNQLTSLLPSSPVDNGSSLGLVLGSRAHLAEKSIASREFYRTVLMRGFHMLVMLLCTRSIQDTQCGFKLFTRRAAEILFGNLHLYRWAFDIEIIYQAEMLGIPMKEVSVNWREVEGSKLIRSKIDVVTTSLTMARDMLSVRLSYLLGIWKLPSLSAQADAGSGIAGKEL